MDAVVGWGSGSAGQCGHERSAGMCREEVKQP